MGKLFDLAVKVGTYQKGDETKNKYKNIGVMMEGEKGPYILLDKTFNPAGVPSEQENIMVSLFEPKAKGAPSVNTNDEIPF